VLAALVAVVAAAGGCGDDGAGSAGPFTPATEGALTVATSDLPVPGFWTGPADRPTGGFEHGLAGALADHLGLDDVTVVEVPFDDLVDGDLGGADLALAQLTPTAERDRHLDFTDAYLRAPPGVLVRAGTEVPDVHAARRLSWAVQDATTLEDALEDQVRPQDAPDRVGSLATLVALVGEGAVDAALVDLPTGLSAAAGSGGELAVAAQLPGDEVLAAAVPDGSDDLQAVDSALRALAADGTLDGLADRWLATGGIGDLADVPALRTGDA
jgi:polar amino acid transport system substrate-binding protein